MTSTTPAPNTVIVSRCARRWLPPGSNCSITHDVGVSASAVSGGCSAVWEPSRKSVKPCPAGDRVGLGVVVDLVAQDGLGALGQQHVADAQGEGGEHDQQQDAPEPAGTARRGRLGARACLDVDRHAAALRPGGETARRLPPAPVISNACMPGASTSPVGEPSGHPIGVRRRGRRSGPRARSRRPPGGAPAACATRWCRR